ncbi:MAG: hypothetical protein AABM43_10360 [Actinomycetota bacterium]
MIPELTIPELKRQQKILDNASRVLGTKSPLNEIAKASQFYDQFKFRGVSDMRKSILGVSAMQPKGLLDPTLTRRLSAGVAASGLMPKVEPASGSSLARSLKQFETVRSASIAARLHESGAIASLARYPLGRYTASSFAPQVADLNAGIRFQRDFEHWSRTGAATIGGSLNRDVMSLAGSRELARTNRQLALAGVASNAYRFPNIKTFDPKTFATLAAISSQLDQTKLNLPPIALPSETRLLEVMKQFSAAMEMKHQIGTQRLLDALANVPTAEDVDAQPSLIEVEPEVPEASASAGASFLEEGPAWLVLQLAMVFTSTPPEERKEFIREVLAAGATSTSSGLLIVQGNTPFAAVSLVGAWIAWDQLIDHIKRFTGQR